MAATHKIAAGVALAAACATALAGCASDTTGSKEGAYGPEKAGAPAPKSAVRLIGDGSTSYTGAQPHLPRPERLKPGQKPRSSSSSPGTAPERTARSCSRTSARWPRPTTPR
ncbi:hypothetical protein SAVCW2_33530 [Streptomyces avermitilis]|nr:hypothetical protein SAVCW2_33530 [Streptomyces avermitilis]